MAAAAAKLAQNVTLSAMKRRPTVESERVQRKIRGLRRVYGQFATRDSRAAVVQLAQCLGFVDISNLAKPELLEYVKKAAEFQEFTLSWMAENVGDGECGPNPASMIATAALQLAASRFAFEKLGNIPLFSRLGDASARNLALAHELLARETACRPKQGPHALLAALQPEAKPAEGEGQTQGQQGGASEQAGQGQAGQAGQQASQEGASEGPRLEVEGESVGGKP